MPLKLSHLSAVRSLIAFSLVLVGLMVTIPVSYSQTEAWSLPVPLSSPETVAWFPDVTTDTTGEVHVVWAAQDSPSHDYAPGDTFDYVMYTDSQDGQRWAATVDVMAFRSTSEATREATRPAILVDKNGILHMAYRYTSVYYSRVPAESASIVSAWRPRHQVSSFQVAYFSRLAIDGQGRLHLVYTENVPAPPDCPICFHIFYRWSDDGGFSWSSLIDISKLPIGSAKPQIVIDKQDYIHLVWEAGQGGAYGQLAGPTKVMYAASYDRGKTWTSPVEFAAPGSVGKNITIGLDGRGKLVVAWLDITQDIVYYQFSSDQGHSWSPPQPIPGVWGGWSVYEARLDDYAMATDSAGDVHLVFVGRTARDQKFLKVLHLRWDGSTWSQPEVITDYVGDVAEWPRVAISNGNQLHVVWYVRATANIWGIEDVSKLHRVWYAHGQTSAPALTPVAWPTRTPTPKTQSPNVGATSTPIATPTPIPTLAPDLIRTGLLPGTIDSLYTDKDDIILLIKSLIPAALIIAVVVISARFWRR